MTKAEIIERIRKGCDIMLDVKNRHFTILAQEEMGFSIDEQYPNDGNEQIFKTAKDLVENYNIDGIPLGEFSNKITITDYTLSGIE